MGFILTKTSLNFDVVIPVDNIAYVSTNDEAKALVHFKAQPETSDLVIHAVHLDCTVPEFMALIQEATSAQVTTINKLTVNRAGDLSHAVATGLEHRGG